MSALREYYPAALAAFGADLADRDAVAVLSLAPTPDAGRALSLAKTAAALRAGYLHAPPAIAAACGAAARSAIRLISAYTAELEQALPEHFERHRTRRSSAPCQDWGRSSAPGCPASSVMTGPGLPAPGLARTTPAPHPSPKHPAAATQSWPATPATGTWHHLQATAA